TCAVPIYCFLISRFIFSSRRRHTRSDRDWSSDVCSSDLLEWSTVRMEHRPVSKTGLIPAQAFEQERAALVALPAHLPAPYLCHEIGRASCRERVEISY